MIEILCLMVILGIILVVGLMIFALLVVKYLEEQEGFEL